MDLRSIHLKHLEFIDARGTATIDTDALALSTERSRHSLSWGGFHCPKQPLGTKRDPVGEFFVCCYRSYRKFCLASICLVSGISLDPKLSSFHEA